MEQKTINMNGVVPNDLVIDILERLPAKSVARFRFVSRGWYDLIKNPIFINNHQGKKHKMLMVFRRIRNSTVLSLHNLDSPEQAEVRRNVSKFLKFNKCDRFICLGGLWSNGIVCIIHNSRIVLCNPTSNEFKFVPHCPRDNVNGYFESVLFEGFGVTCTGEIKVIRVCTFMNGPRRNFSSAAPPNSFPVHLYNSTTNSWKQIGFEYSCLPLSSNDKQLFFNGASHWLASQIGKLTGPVILCFNVASEAFKQLELPESYGSLSMGQLAVVNDCLAIGHYCNSFRVKFVIWVMEYGIRESWTKQVIMMPEASPLINKILYWENDELLLTETTTISRFGAINRFDAITRFAGPPQLAHYSFLTSSTQKLSEYQVTGDEYNMQALIYQESLLSLN